MKRFIYIILITTLCFSQGMLLQDRAIRSTVSASDSSSFIGLGTPVLDINYMLASASRGLSVDGKLWLDNGALFDNTTNANVAKITEDSVKVAGTFSCLSYPTAPNSTMNMMYGSGNSGMSGGNNILIGLRAGDNLTSGTGNIFLGTDTGGITSGSNGIFIGTEAGKSTSGSNNIYLGYRAGYTNTTGTGNNYIGYQSGFYFTGSRNTFNGYVAGTGVTGQSSGADNSFFGYAAGRGNTSGSYGVAVGDSAGYNNTTGSRNVFIGYKAIGTATSSDQFVVQSDNGLKTQRLMQGSFADSSLIHNGNVRVIGELDVDSASVAVGKMLFADETPIAPVLAGADTYTRFGVNNAMTVQAFGNITKTSKSLVINREGYYDVTAAASIGCDQPTATVHFGIARNNTVMTYAQAEYTSKDANDVHSVTIPNLPYLYAGDSLYVMVKSDAQTDSLRIKHLNVIVSKKY